jgi:hypothetical protein
LESFLKGESPNQLKMTRSNSTLLVVLLAIFTFPIWIGLAGGLFGLAAGLLGAIFGIIAGVFGAIFGVIGSLFGLVFGIFDWNSNGLFNWHFPYSGIRFFLIVAMVFVIVLMVNSKKKKSS